MSENYNLKNFLALGARKYGIGGLLLFLSCSLGSIAFGQGPCTQTAPFQETFSSGALPNCWTNTSSSTSTSSNVLWKFDGSPGYQAAPTYNGKANGTYAWVDASVPNVGVHDVTLTTPPIDLSSLTSPYLKFEWFKDNQQASSGNNNPLIVEITDGSTGWTSLFNDTSNAPTWRAVGIALPAAYQNATVQIRFVVDKDGSGDYYDDLLLDEVQIVEEPTCFAPLSPVASNITVNSADINWTAPTPAPANGYEYYYNTSGVAPTAATTASGSVPSGTTANVTGLSPSSTYHLWVRSVCSSTDKSVWSTAEAVFSTLCGVATAPFMEPFSSGDLPNCWTNTTSSSSTSANVLWKFDGSPSYLVAPSYNGKANGTYAWVDASTPNSGVHDVTLTTPPIDISTLSQPYLKFEWYKDNQQASSGANNVLTVEISDGTTGWTNLFSDTSNAPLWRSVGITLPAAYQNDTIQLRFIVDKDGSGDFYDDLLLDEIEVKEAPSCFPPTLPVASSITSNSVSISWTAPTPAPGNGYEYYYNTTGVAPTSSTTPSGSVASGTTASISGLTSNTDYTVWVRSHCNATDQSIWSASVTFTTLCHEIAPWVYDVESAATTTNSSIEDCWTSSPSVTTSDYRWNVDGSGSTPSANTGPSGANSGTNYFYTEASNGSTGAIALLTSPLVDVSSLTTPALKFFYHMYGSDMGNLYIEVSDGTAWTVVDSIKGQQQTDENDPWRQKIITLSGFSSSIQVRFKAERGTGLAGDMSLDDISVIEAPTCFAPLQPDGSNITATSADISWVAPTPAPANGYEYYYNTSGTPPTASTTPSGTVASGTSTTISGLSSNTDYTVWIRSVCSGTDNSLWSLPVTFTTACLESAPWTYDVESAATTTTAAIADCWSTAPNGSGQYAWNIDGSGSTPSSNTGPSGAYSGSKYFYIEDSYGSTGDSAFLNSPMVDISALTQPMLSFYYHMYGADIGNLYIQLLDAGTNTWTTVDSIKGQQQLSETDPWLPFYYDLSGFTGPVKLRLTAVNTGVFEGDISIDDISFIEFPVCDPPTTITTDNITQNSAILHWDDDTTKSYVLEYGITGFTLGTGTIIVTDTNDYELTGLDPNTTYDYYLRKICIPGLDTGAYSAMEQFTTLCNIVTVDLGSDDIICEGTSITLDAGNVGSTYLWSDNSTGQTLTVTSGGTYSVTVTNQYGCVGTDAIQLSPMANPVVDLGPDREICEGATVTLDAGNPGMNYLWSTSEITQVISVTNGGDYYVAVKDANDCTGTDTITITENLAPLVSGITAIRNTTDGSYDFTAQGTQGQMISSYFWDFGDGNTSTDEAPSHLYDNTGNFVVTLIVENSCGTDTVTTILHGIGTGIDQLQLGKDQLKLYPNPATDQLTIQNDSRYKMQRITIYNILGQKVVDVPTPDAHRHRINLSGYASGMYSIRIQLDEGFTMRKFEVIK